MSYYEWYKNTYGIRSRMEIWICMRIDELRLELKRSRSSEEYYRVANLIHRETAELREIRRRYRPYFNK